jgi:uncharacterized small protein (DUF1192 family)
VSDDLRIEIAGITPELIRERGAAIWEEVCRLEDLLRAKQEAREAATNGSPGKAKDDHAGSSEAKQA